MNAKFLAISLCAAALAFAGCSSFDDAVKATYVSEYNEYVTVETCPCKDGHKEYLKTAGAQSVPFVSRYKARVTMGDGTSFVGYESPLNLPGGTGYRSKNGKWVYWAHSPTCIIFCREGDSGDDYREVFEGVLCAQKVPEGAKKIQKYRGEKVMNSPRERADRTNAPKPVTKK